MTEPVKEYWADSHAHLNNAQFKDDLPEVAETLREAGFLVLNVAYDMPSGRQAIELAERYPFMKAAVGVHPHDASTVTEADYAEMRQLAKQDNVVAIGETGLDYFYEHSPKDIQKAVLIEHLKISKECGKPVIIHCRDAFGDIAPIFEEHFDPSVGGVLHCFSDGPEEAKRGLELGFHISFSGNSTYKKAQDIRDAAAIVPPERLLIETDCPYLAPQPMRGKRNEPLFMKETAKVLAELRGVTEADLARLTLSNYKRLFLKEAPAEAEIVYAIRNSLYVNITRACSCHCVFCSRESMPVVQGHYLGVERDPTAEEIILAIGTRRPEELVFCGFGEPTMRLEVVKEVARWAKENNIPTRLNTNGHGNLINKRNILPELKGLIDTASISLNAPDKETYNRLCKPARPEEAFDGVKDFIRSSVAVIPNVVATAVGPQEGLDLAATERLAEELGAKYRLRTLNMVG